MENMADNPVLWALSAECQQTTHMFRFMKAQSIDAYDELFAWSVSDSSSFWQAVCVYCDVRFETPADTVLARPDDIINAGWFQGATLNFAEHLLRHKGPRAAIVFCGEDGTRSALTFPVVVGEEYLVRIGSHSSSSTGTGILVLNCEEGSH